MYRQNKRGLSPIKIISLLVLISVAGFIMVACDSGDKPSLDTRPLLVMITDTGCLGDQSFNDIAWSGLEKARGEMDIDIRCVESQSQEDFERNIEMAIHDDASIIICSGFQMLEATEKMAQQYPEIKFILLDGALEGENITSIVFQDQEVAFLAGVAAAASSKSGIIGFLGGLENQVTEKFQYGFMAGAKAIDPNIVVLSGYIGQLQDKDKGMELATDMASQGTDVIYQVAGASGIGIIQACNNSGIWVIGSIKDQSGLDSKHILCSTTRNSENILVKIIKNALKDKYQGQVHTYTLADGEMTLSEKGDRLTNETKDRIEYWKKEIEKGKVKIPENLDMYLEFNPETSQEGN